MSAQRAAAATPPAIAAAPARAAAVPARAAALAVRGGGAGRRGGGSSGMVGVVSMRFGLTDGQPKTLGEIGKVYGVTRERIRQIESTTMSKLRHPSRSKVLRDYLD